MLPLRPVLFVLLLLPGLAVAGPKDDKREQVRTLCQRGREAVARGDLDAARRLMERARKIDPGSSVVERNLAQIELRAGRPQAAVAVLRRLLRRSPADPVANRLIGRALAELGQLQEAQGHLEKAVATSHPLGPVAEARALVTSGVVRARQGRLFNAMVDLTQAMNVLGSADPKLLEQVRADLARVRVALGVEQLGRGREKAAWSSMRVALGAATSLPHAERVKIQAAVLLGAAVRNRAEQAHQLLRGARVDIQPLLRQAYAPIAARLLEAYTDLSSRDSTRLLRAATSFERMAEQVEAARPKLLAMAVRCRLRAAAALFEAGSIDEARKVHRQALQGVTDPPLAWFHNAAVLDYAAGDRAQAIAALERLKKDVPMAACNLAVHSEQAYAPWRAYQLFKECKARGGRFPGLDAILAARRLAFDEGKKP